ncbi:MAG: anti-sigma factor family protein [Actinomycetes bacterium]
MSDHVDPFTEDDAAYVMGALSAEDRQAFEAHLVDCPQCTESVAELSGMTDLLAKVPLARVLAPGADREQPPDLLMPRLINAARAQRRRRSIWLVASGAVAASLVALAIVIGFTQTQPTQPAAVSVAMTPVRSAPVTATLQMTPATWGTKVSVDCRWVGATTGADRVVKKTYRLVAVPRNGGAEQTLAQWAVLPGEDAKVAGSTDLTTKDIATVELRAVADNAVLLQTPGRSSS